MRLHGRLMVLIVAYRQQPAMHHRVQCLDAAIHHFGKPVNSDTSLTGRPFSPKGAVPPVDISSTPRADNFSAKATMPSLSETDMRRGERVLHQTFAFLCFVKTFIIILASPPPFGDRHSARPSASAYRHARGGPAPPFVGSAADTALSHIDAFLNLQRFSGVAGQAKLPPMAVWRQQ